MSDDFEVRLPTVYIVGIRLLIWLAKHLVSQWVTPEELVTLDEIATSLHVAQQSRER